MVVPGLEVGGDRGRDAVLVGRGRGGAGRPGGRAVVVAGLGGLAAGGRPTVQAIQARTCEAFGVTLDEMRSNTRVARVAWARQVAMYLSRELTDATLPAIGEAFGRTHTTVMHACRRTAERMAEDPAAYEAVRFLTLEMGE